jgi:hypothetical protein
VNIILLVPADNDPNTNPRRCAEAVSIKKVVLWRTEVANRPGALDRVLAPLAEAGADLQVVMGYRYPGDARQAAIEVCPVSGKKSTAAAVKAGLAASAIPTLLVQGDNRPGLGHALVESVQARRASGVREIPANVAFAVRCTAVVFSGAAGVCANAVAAAPAGVAPPSCRSKERRDIVDWRILRVTVSHQWVSHRGFISSCELQRARSREVWLGVGVGATGFSLSGTTLR